MNIQKCQDQCHTDIDTILYLLEINSSWIIINFNRNFVDTRKWMENQHIFWRKFHFPFVQDVEIFHTDIIFLVEETFLLNTCHIKDIEIRKGILQALYFCIWDIFLIQRRSRLPWSRGI